MPNIIQFRLYLTKLLQKQNSSTFYGSQCTPGFSVKFISVDCLFTHRRFSSADATSARAWRFTTLCHLHRLCASIRRLCI